MPAPVASRLERIEMIFALHRGVIINICWNNLREEVRMRYIAIVLVILAFFIGSSTSALCSDVYFEQWDGGTTAGWGPANQSSATGIQLTGGNPGGCLAISGSSGNTVRIGATASVPGVSGDYWANGIALVTFDMKISGGSSVQAFFRIHPVGDGKTGWLRRIPSTTAGGDPWIAVTAGLNEAWDDAEANLAGWIKEMDALSFHETMTQVAAVEILFMSATDVDVLIDNFRFASSMECTTDRPQPALVFKGKSVGGDFQISWNFSIENWYDYPGEMFLIEPELPPCGYKEGAPRTFVRFFRSNGQELAQLCTITDPAQLGNIGFTADLSGSPKVYVELYDRSCDLVYRSNTVTAGSANNPPVAFAGEDMKIKCTGWTTPVTLDGSGSSDPDGDDLTYQWYAEGIVFDDPTAPVAVGHFPIGTYLVVLKVSDPFTSRTDVAQVKVVDTKPPVLHVELDRSVVWPPNHKYFDIHANVTADDCDPSPRIILEEIFLKDGPAGGEFDQASMVHNAELGAMDTDFQILAERKGGDARRTYGIVYRAWDAVFHSTEETVYVDIPHDQSGHALPAAGFDAAGGSLDSRAACFALVVPSESERGSHPAFDASAVVAREARVSTSKGTLKPVSAYVGDVTGDGLDDMLLFYSSAGAADLLRASDGGEELSFYYGNSTGDIYTVRDVFSLGRPVSVSMSDLRLLDGFTAVGSKEAAVRKPQLSEAAPSGPSLDQAYPNPFNPAVNLTYSIPSNGAVTLAVYDVSGRVVRSLVSKQQPAGTFTEIWNALDDGGTRVPSGVYFVRFRFDNIIKTRKIVLLN
jgi:hypothetical protein